MYRSKRLMLIAAVLPVALLMAFAPVSKEPVGHLATDPTALSAAAMSGSLTDAVLQKVFDGKTPNFPSANR